MTYGAVFQDASGAKHVEKFEDVDGPHASRRVLPEGDVRTRVTAQWGAVNLVDFYRHEPVGVELAGS